MKEYHLVSVHRGKWYFFKDKYKGKVPLEPLGGGENEGIAGTFFHEIAHAIYYVLLDDRARAGVGALHRWTNDKIGNSSKSWPFAPLWDRHGKKKPYSLSTPEEFFAEWVGEYFIAQTTGKIPKHSFFAPRKKILDQFFSSKGLNLRAFDQNNIQAAHRESGIEMSLGWWDWISPLHFGVKLLSLSYAGRGLSSDGEMLSLQPGITYRPGPIAMMYGAGVLLGRSSTSAFLNNSDGTQDIFDIKSYDLGVWGMAGYHFPSFELQVRPRAGYRRTRIGGRQLDPNDMTFTPLPEEKNWSPWFGGEVFVRYKTLSFLGLWAGGEVIPGQGHSFGAGVSVDFTRFFTNY